MYIVKNRRVLTSIILLPLLLFIADRVGGWMMKALVSQNKEDKIVYMINELDEDVLFMGSSRCNFHYVPSIISDSLNMSVYNCGVNASQIHFQFILLNHILAHHSPKLICLEVKESDLGTSWHHYPQITNFAPYIGEIASNDSVFEEAGIKWKYELSHLYRFNLNCASNILHLLVPRHSQSDHGYVPKTLDWDPIYELEKEQEIELDTVKLKYYKKFIQICQLRGIPLIFFRAPSFSIMSSNERYVKSLAEEYNIPFFDYQSKGLFWDRNDYFLDRAHMKHEGACRYSEIVGSDLKHYLDSIHFYN